MPLNGKTEDDKIYNVVQPDICVVCDLSKLDEKVRVPVHALKGLVIDLDELFVKFK